MAESQSQSHVCTDRRRGPEILVMQLEAKLIQEAAEESPSREWGRGSEHEAALCPKCATPLQARGKRKRTLQGNGGQNVTLSRTYGTCPKCGEGLFPPR